MNKFGNCPLCGKQAMSANLRKIARQNQLYGFHMALDGIAATWGALIQNLRCDADLTDEQVQKIIRIGDRYWEMVGQFKNENMVFYKNWAEVGSEIPYAVTHWIPLPEPPKEDEHE